MSESSDTDSTDTELESMNSDTRPDDVESDLDSDECEENVNPLPVEEPQGQPFPNLEPENNVAADFELHFELASKPFVKKDQKKFERGGNVLLPASVLETLISVGVPPPYMFQVMHKGTHSFSHVGVVEFTAREGEVNIPPWLMSHLGLNHEDTAIVEYVLLPNATYCRLEPLSRNLAYISDTKQVLEQNFKHFTCLTEGDILNIHEIELNQIYRVKVVETRPASAVRVIDVNVDLDLELPKKCTNKTSAQTKEVRKVFQPFQGQGQRLGGSEEESSSPSDEINQNSNKPARLNCNKSKRKTVSSEDEPEHKKTRTEDDSFVRELIFIRKQQEGFSQHQSSSEPKPFAGKGHTLKDNNKG